MVLFFEIFTPKNSLFATTKIIISALLIQPFSAIISDV
tara:strand:- start:1096 stop:1209 length:114 start_codon:yes stop_codon:yes gene_type:complete